VEPAALPNTLPPTAQEIADAAMRKEAMVFEVGLMFVVMHYQSIFVGAMRCLFQSFRPLLIPFAFGQILKAVFFNMGTPILVLLLLDLALGSWLRLGSVRNGLCSACTGASVVTASRT